VSPSPGPFLLGQPVARPATGEWPKQRDNTSAVGVQIHSLQNRSDSGGLANHRTPNRERLDSPKILLPFFLDQGPLSDFERPPGCAMDVTFALECVK